MVDGAAQRVAVGFEDELCALLERQPAQQAHQATHVDRLRVGVLAQGQRVEHGEVQAIAADRIDGGGELCFVGCKSGVERGDADQRLVGRRDPGAAFERAARDHAGRRAIGRQGGQLLAVRCGVEQPQPRMIERGVGPAGGLSRTERRHVDRSRFVASEERRRFILEPAHVIDRQTLAVVARQGEHGEAIAACGSQAHERALDGEEIGVAVVGRFVDLPAGRGIDAHGEAGGPVAVAVRSFKA